MAPAYADEFRKGTAAMDKGLNAEADSLYSIVYENVPDFDPVVRRLGSIKVILGEREAGIALCEEALSISRSSDNILTLASCLASPVDSLTAAPSRDLQKSLSLLEEGKTLPGADEKEYYLMIAPIAGLLNARDNFRQATRVLITKYPDQMASHYFAAQLAATDKDWVAADREIRIAHKMGLPAEEMNAFLNSGVSAGLNPVQGDSAFDFAMELFFRMFGIWALGFLLLYILGVSLSAYTLKSIERQVITNEIQSNSILRKFYKILIHSAGFYYYISIPVVLFLVTCVGFMLAYEALRTGSLPFQTLMILLVCAFATIFPIIAMVRSLFLNPESTGPGRLLKEEGAPGLFALTKEVAATMNTRAINEIRITRGTHLEVYETGPWRQKVRDKGKRILVVGAGLLKDFRKHDFRAMLAHEYGHFSHNNTAGGGVALRVRRDISNYCTAIYSAGLANSWNAGFTFLQFYNFIFSRISTGSIRLQEVLADRFAAQAYGAQSFRNGLIFVIRRNIEFRLSIYGLPGQLSEEIEKELEEALSKKTSEEDDTHPGPADRFRYIEGIEEQDHADDQECINDLFTDWDAIMLEMT